MYKQQLMLVFVSVAVCCNNLLAQEIQDVKVSETRIAIDVPLQIQIEFNSANALNPTCGLEINFGDGNINAVRVGTNGPQDFPLKLTHSYRSPGQYALRVEGKPIFRGFKSALACSGSVKQLTVTAFDETAERAKEEAIKEQKAAEVAKEEAAIKEQKAAAMAKEAAIREQKLAAREAELKRLAETIEREKKLQATRDRQRREQELKTNRSEVDHKERQSQQKESQGDTQSLQGGPKSNTGSSQTKTIDGF